ncbi:MAG: prolyl oligopeptidase family serine peptidase [Candidatus Pacebacteria bacterium]|nr:prolyl oligopeptidase family serine peptidase [Candidatus Paceibacterota bacterium]
MGFLVQYKYKLLILGMIIFSPLLSFATGITYGDILSQTTDSFILKYGNTDTPDYYNCTVSTLSCNDLGKTEPTLPTGTPSTSRFSYTTSSVFKNNVHLRTLYLTDNQTGKTYTRSYKLSSWDTLGDEGTIVSFSPDGTRMVYQDDSSGYPVLYSLDLTTLKGKAFKGIKIFSKSTTVNGFDLATANNLYFISNKASPYEWDLYKYDFTTKITSIITENASYAFKIRNWNTGITFFVIKGASSFPEFYNTTTNQIQNFSGIVPDNTTVDVNSADIYFGGGMHGVLMTPLNFDKNSPHTLVIWLHGGPYRQTSLGYHDYASYAVYDLILNQLAENNVAVLKLDYRGSYGYGVAYSKEILKNVGKGDVTDVVNALSVVKKDMSISDTYLLGNSYGGYLALRSLMAYPAKFSGAISINGVTDWAVMLKLLRTSIFNVDFGGLPGKSNAALYAKASILSRISNLTNQKVVLMQSQADKTVPPSQANLLYNALQTAGKNVQFIPYAGEDHTFTKTPDIENICQNIFNTLALPLDNNCSFQ